MGVAVACALMWVMSCLVRPADCIARVIARAAPVPSGSGATRW
ncbi:Uncharacterised protein [Mycobacteroides abscessus subsp. abscessus]|nr:Uncharacterised protein [Mycobacteroides abscessus subsp. abscessus]